MNATAAPEPEKWLTEYGDMLYRYALLKVRSEATAEDLVQETLLSGIQSYKNFNGQSALNTWLVGILKHKILDYYRKTAREAAPLNTSALGKELLAYQFDSKDHWQINLVEWNTPDLELDNQHFWQVFHDCLSRLPDNVYRLFMLRTMDGCSSEECCKLLNFSSTNQMWVALSRARMKLRHCLDKNWFEKE